MPACTRFASGMALDRIVVAQDPVLRIRDTRPNFSTVETALVPQKVLGHLVRRSEPRPLPGWRVRIVRPSSTGAATTAALRGSHRWPTPQVVGSLPG